MSDSEEISSRDGFSEEFLLREDYSEGTALWDLSTEARELKREKQKLLRKERAKKRLARFDTVLSNKREEFPEALSESFKLTEEVVEKVNQLSITSIETQVEIKNMVDYFRNIEIYKDTKVSIDKWLRRFEAAVKLSKITDENEKKTTLLLFLGDNAADFVEKIENESFTEICRMLRERFNSQEFARSAESKLCTFKLDLRDHENVEIKLLELFKLVKDSMPMSDDKKIDFEQQREVRRSITSNDWLYDRSTIKDYDKAIHLIRDIVIWNVQYRERREFRKNGRNKNRLNRPSWKGEISDNYVINVNPKKRNPAVKIVCYDFSANGIGAVNEKRKIKFHEPTSVEWEEINSAYPVVSDLIYTEVNLRGSDNEIRTILGMIDSGSQATIVRDEIVKQLKLDSLVRRSNFKIKGFFSNEQVIVKGEITLKLLIGNEKAIMTNAGIIDDACMDTNLDIILGVTLKDYVKDIVNCAILKGEVDGNNNKIKLVKCCKVMVQQRMNKLQIDSINEKVICDIEKKMPDVRSLFSKNAHDIGLCNLTPDKEDFKIYEEKLFNVNTKAYKTPRHLVNVEFILLDELVKSNIACEDITPTFVSNVLLVQKCEIPDDLMNDRETSLKSFRIVIDLRDLNKITIPIPFCSESVEDIIYKTYDSCETTPKIFSSIDLFMGRVLTLLRLPQGYKNSPALLTDVLRKAFLKFDVPGSSLNWYIDDSLLSSVTYENHIDALIVLSKTLKSLNLKVNIRKSTLARETVKMLGHELHGRNNSVTPSVEAKKIISSWKVPSDCPNVKKFLKILGYYLKYLPNQVCVLKPLRKIVRISKLEERKCNKSYFEFDDECMKSFERVKRNFAKAILYHEVKDAPLEIYSDSSLNYYVDNIPLVGALTKGRQGVTLSAQENSWLVELSLYNIEFIHIKGCENWLADLLSRPTNTLEEYIVEDCLLEDTFIPDDKVGKTLSNEACTVLNNAVVSRSCFKNQNAMRIDKNVKHSPPTTVAVKRGRGRPRKFSVIEKEKPDQDKLAFTEVEENEKLENYEHELTENNEINMNLKERKGIWRKQDEIFVPEKSREEFTSIVSKLHDIAHFAYPKMRMRLINIAYHPDENKFIKNITKSCLHFN
uniref:Reverse transcriptase domain-containing protein n=1 Tax=Strongyloides venezuelensis TaxID=75913 RepID=A0A0K0FRD1_STRVS